MTRDRLSAAALLVIAVLLALATRGWAAAAVLAAALLGATVIRPRASFGSVGQALAMIAGGTLCGALAFTLPTAAPEALGRLWTIAAFTALGAATARLYLHAPVGGPLTTFLMGLAALTAAGEAHTGPYTAAVAAYLALGLLALRAGDSGRPAVHVIPRRSLALAAAALGLTVAIAQALSRSLPPLSTWTQDRVIDMMSGGDSQTGFSDRLWLGSLDGMLQSDEVVMRLDGPHVDYLRGTVYNHYDTGRWTVAAPSPPAPFPAGGPRPEGPSVTRAILAGGARDRHFLPLGAGGIATQDDGGLRIDRFGTLLAQPGEATAIWFQTSGVPALPIAPPGPEDLAIPAELRAPLARLASDFTAGATTPDAKIVAIARRLRTDYRYSLQFERKLRDPLLDFLLEHKKGHCEYFASAMALLARSAGIPARVAAGYRVIERNELGDHDVVRERNAHAWVEVYDPHRGWQTVDATPASDVAAAPSRMGLVGALGDLAAAWWASAWSSRRVPLRALAVAGGAAVILALARRILSRRTGAARGSPSAPADPPPPSLVRLLDALARRGAVRPPSEPLERFAVRLQALGLGDAAALLRQYAALRYGGDGDPDVLASAMDGCTARLRR